jgi:hypothetical protein
MATTVEESLGQRSATVYKHKESALIQLEELTQDWEPEERQEKAVDLPISRSYRLSCLPHSYGL